LNGNSIKLSLNLTKWTNSNVAKINANVNPVDGMFSPVIADYHTIADS
jgi:hypothetical protein